MSKHRPKKVTPQREKPVAHNYEDMARNLVRKGLASAGILESPLFEARSPKFQRPSTTTHQEANR